VRRLNLCSTSRKVPFLVTNVAAKGRRGARDGGVPRSHGKLKGTRRRRRRQRREGGFTRFLCGDSQCNGSVRGRPGAHDQARFKDVTLEQKVACAAEACSFASDYAAAYNARIKETAAKEKVYLLRAEAEENQRPEKRRRAEMDAVILLDCIVRVCEPCRKARKTTHEMRCKEHDVCFKALVKSKLG